MAKIRYAVIGIDPQHLSNLVGTLARGEVEGMVDAVVLPAMLPTVYAIGDGSKSGNGFREVPFSQFLTDQVGKARKLMVEKSPGEKLISDVVEKVTVAVNSGKG